MGDYFQTALLRAHLLKLKQELNYFLRDRQLSANVLEDWLWTFTPRLTSCMEWVAPMRCLNRERGTATRMPGKRRSDPDWPPNWSRMCPKQVRIGQWLVPRDPRAHPSLDNTQMFLPIYVIYLIIVQHHCKRWRIMSITHSRNEDAKCPHFTPGGGDSLHSL